MALVVSLWLVAAALAQSTVGELRLFVTDGGGLPIQGAVEIVSDASQLRLSLQTRTDGTLVAPRLPFGRYRVVVTRDGFAPFAGLVDIASAAPADVRVTLALAPVQAQVDVSADETVLDLHATSTVNRIGADTLERRASALPGRALVDLVNTQPGWLLEANGSLHPRGSEYQVQHVVDGLPMLDNRSPSFAPEIDADDVQALNILTAGYPAEYGRKLGGIVEVVTAGVAREGLHGSVVASGGSFATAGLSGAAEYSWPRQTIAISGHAARTGRFLDPPVEENFTNDGRGSGVALHVERELTSKDRIGAIVRHGRADFLVPNERVQEEAGQRQARTSRETSGQFSWQRVVSPNVVFDARSQVRGLSAGLSSNAASTPIAAAQDRGFREVYVKAAASVHAGAHEWKAGGDVDAATLREQFAYAITDPDAFDAGVPRTFAFADRRPDREVALFVQDRVQAGPVTVTAGLRWDRYALLVTEHAFSPRLGAAWSWPAANLVVRAAYDRAFQTPATENLLLASSPDADALGDDVVRLPVAPSRGDFFEAGVSKRLGGFRLDLAHFLRRMTNFADDDLLFNTGVSFPMAFDRARIRGTEVKLELPRRGRLSGSVSYTHMHGVGAAPVTGGLLLDAGDAALLTSDEAFDVSQDQRHTARGRVGFQFAPRAWFAVGASYGSGLPVETDEDRDAAAEQYGERIVERVDFEQGRVKPSFTLDASASVVLFKNTRTALRLQADVLNLTNRLNVINFAGLFSGTAVAPPRSAAVRLHAQF